MNVKVIPDPSQTLTSPKVKSMLLINKLKLVLPLKYFQIYAQKYCGLPKRKSFIFVYLSFLVSEDM